MTTIILKNFDLISQFCSYVKNQLFRFQQIVLKKKPQFRALKWKKINYEKVKPVTNVWKQF